MIGRRPLRRVSAIAPAGSLMIRFLLMFDGARLRTLLNIQAGESRPVGVMTGYFTLLIFAFLVGRTVRDAIFLSQYGIETLPYMYIGTAIAVAFCARLYGRMAPRFDARRLTFLTTLSFAGVFIGFRVLLSLDAGLMTFSALYLWVEVFGALALLEFWNAASDVFEQRQAKRVFGLISSGQVVSNILCGVVASWLSVRWGVENLLWLVAAALLLLLPLHGMVAGYRGRGRSSPRQSATVGEGDETLLRKHRGYVVTIAAVVALTFIVTSIVDFQFKLAAREAFEDRDALGRFFGIFYAVVGLFGFVLQTFFSGRITKALGVLETLAVMPALFILGSLGQLLMPGLASATTTKFFENTLRYSLNDPATQLLYLPLPQRLRIRALSFTSGIVKPVAIGVAGVLMLLVAPFMEFWLLGIPVILLCGFWLTMLMRLKGGYLGAVASGTQEARSLLWQRPHLDATLPLVQEALLRNLQNAQGASLDYALSVAEKVDAAGLDEHLRARLRAGGSGTARVLKTLEVRADPAFADDIREILGQPVEPAVTAAALGALGAVEGPASVPTMRRYLMTADPVIKAGVLRALLRHGGTKGSGLALGNLDDMLASVEQDARRLAIHVVADTDSPHPLHLLEPLLSDPEEDIRKEALRALTVRCPDEALDVLREAADRPETVGSACDALGRLGEEGVPALVEVLLDEQRPMDTRAAALHGLQSSLAPTAAEAVGQHLIILPVALRDAGARMLFERVRLMGWRPEEEIRLVLQHFCRQLVSEAAWWFHLKQVSSKAGHPFLGETLGERLLNAELQALRILGVLNPKPEILALVRPEVLLDNRKRSLLLELLENISAGSVGRELTLVMEGQRHSEIRARAMHHGRLPASAMELEETLRMGEDRWLKACATWTIIQREEGQSMSEQPEVQDMVDLVKKVMLLKSASLFESLSGEDAEKIAVISRRQIFKAGETIFEQGADGDALYIIESGLVRVHIGDQEVARIGERECFGEMAILDDQPRSASISAVEDTECLLLYRDDFYALMERHFEIVRGVLGVLTTRLRGRLQPASGGK